MPKTVGLFLAFYCENLLGFLWVNPIMCWVSSDCISRGASHSQDSPHSASSNLSSFKCFYQIMAPAASAPVEIISAVTLDILVSSDFKMTVWPVFSTFWWVQERHYFFVQIFLVLRKKNITDRSNHFQDLNMSQLKPELLSTFKSN